MLCEQRDSFTNNRNPEDGISPADLQILFDNKVHKWNNLWLILFPDPVTDIPYPGTAIFEASRTAFSLGTCLLKTFWCRL